MFCVNPVLRVCVLVAVFAAPSPGALAQPAGETYPAKTIRFICPFPPGGANDLLARLFAQKMADTLGSRCSSITAAAPAARREQ